MTAVRRRSRDVRKHPLGRGGKQVSANNSRVVLYDSIGPGPHPCHWCGKMLEWFAEEGKARSTLEADHVDYDIRNDAPENLVPCCVTCNNRRRRSGKPLIDDGMPRFRRSDNGALVRTVAKVCSLCGVGFLCRKPARSETSRGRFCSKTCRSRYAAAVRLQRPRS